MPATHGGNSAAAHHQAQRKTTKRHGMTGTAELHWDDAVMRSALCVGKQAVIQRQPNGQEAQHNMCARTRVAAGDGGCAVGSVVSVVREGDAALRVRVGVTGFPHRVHGVARAVAVCRVQSAKRDTEPAAAATRRAGWQSIINTITARLQHHVIIITTATATPDQTYCRRGCRGSWSPGARTCCSRRHRRCPAGTPTS
jgi:hypothetical protein